MSADPIPARPRRLADPAHDAWLASDHRLPVPGGRRSDRRDRRRRRLCLARAGPAGPAHAPGHPDRRGVDRLRPDGHRRARRFGTSRREVVTFDQIPKVLIDATTAVEDKTFWENAGFDPVAIVSAGLSSIRGDSRGASTITQQLVRARLLDPELVKDPHRTAERKLKEIIQSIRLTNAFPGEQGKQQIITAYLNQNYYGNQSYGVKAAVDSYFGTDLSKITPSQAAIIAGLPKSPSNYDLVRNAIEKCSVTVAEGDDCPPAKRMQVVQDDTAVVQRRNLILDLLAQGRTPESGNEYTPAQFQAAKSDQVVLETRQTHTGSRPTSCGLSATS